MMTKLRKVFRIKDKEWIYSHSLSTRNYNVMFNKKKDDYQFMRKICVKYKLFWMAITSYVIENLNYHPTPGKDKSVHKKKET
jgi:hypothetical protein